MLIVMEDDVRQPLWLFTTPEAFIYYLKGHVLPDGRAYSRSLILDSIGTDHTMVVVYFFVSSPWGPENPPNERSSMFRLYGRSIFHHVSLEL